VLRVSKELRVIKETKVSQVLRVSKELRVIKETKV
jgi:hypothetical protein